MAHPASELIATDVTRVLGDVSASTIERIIESGGTSADLAIAYLCLMGQNDRQEGELGPLAGKAAQIFDILMSDPALAPIEEDR